MSSGDSWARARGRHRVQGEAGPPARREREPEAAPALVSQGVRSERPPPTFSAEAFLRGQTDLTEIVGELS